MADDPRNQTDSVHALALKRADEAYVQERDNIDNGRDDQRFYVGEQWPDDVRQQRVAQNRPVITINLQPGFVRQLTGDIRQNTPSIKVMPSGGEATEAAARIYSGLIRDIENVSNAKSAYVTAAECAAQTGWGAWRIETAYSSDTSFDQVIKISRITDPFSVLVDPQAREADKSDARYAFVLSDLTREQFEKDYPDYSMDDFPNVAGSQTSMTWKTADKVKIAEYWYREPAKKTLYLWSDGTVADKDAKDSPEAKAMGVTTAHKRNVDGWQIKSVIMNGKENLTPTADWAGKYIPICVVTGEETYLDGRCVRKGMVRDAKDPQRVYNYTRTMSVEAVALQPKAPWIGTVKQFGVGTPLESTWTNAGADNVAFLPYAEDANAKGPPQRSQPAMAANGLDVQSSISAEDVKRVTGIYDASLGQRSNETSGRAILARQKEGDTGTYLYIDNLATAIRHCGRIIVDLIPHIYDASRIVRVLEEDGVEHQMVTVNEVKQDAAGAEIVLNDLSAGDYDVTVISGPSYATKRAEAAESMISFIQAVPAAAAATADLVAKNMDWPGSEKFSERLKRTIPPGILGPDADPDQMKPPPTDPSVVAKAEADAAKADLTRAQTEGQEIENVTAGVSLMATLQAMHSTMQMVQGQLAGLQRGPQAPPPGPPPGPEMGGPMPGGPQPMPMDAAPMPSMPPPDQAAMGELVPMPQ